MSGAPPVLIVATRNDHKLRELGELLPGFELRPLPAGIELPPEEGESFAANALAKARAARQASGEAAIADDSGIEVDALGGKPGPRSARFAGERASDEQNLVALMRAVAGIPGGGRTARYRCVAAIAWPDGSERHAEAVCEGMLVGKRRGSAGFGYDPIFLPAGWDQTMAELTDEQKDRISHRGRAFRALGAELAGDRSAGLRHPS